MIGDLYEECGISPLTEYISSFDLSTRNISLYDPSIDSKEYENVLKSTYVSRTPSFGKTKKQGKKNSTPKGMKTNISRRKDVKMSSKTSPK